MNPTVFTYAELLTAPIGTLCVTYFPFVYVRAPWGPAQIVCNDEFTPP